MSRKSETEQLSINQACYRFAFAADFNLKRRIGAIRRPNMGNVINLRGGCVGGRGARLSAAAASTGATRYLFLYSIELGHIQRSCRRRRLPPTRHDAFRNLKGICRCSDACRLTSNSCPFD